MTGRGPEGTDMETALRLGRGAVSMSVAIPPA